MKTLAYAPLTTPEDYARNGFADFEFCPESSTEWLGVDAPDSGLIRLHDDGGFELLKFTSGDTLQTFGLTKEDYEALQAMKGECS